MCARLCRFCASPCICCKCANVIHILLQFPSGHLSWMSSFFSLIADDFTFKSCTQMDVIHLLIYSSSLLSQISFLYLLCSGPGVINDNCSYLYHYKAIPSRQAGENSLLCLDIMSISQGFRSYWLLQSNRHWSDSKQGGAGNRYWEKTGNYIHVG